MKLTVDILSFRRQHFIDRVKAPLLKAICLLAKKYPEPTKENTCWANTHLLIDIWKKFDKYHHNDQRKELFDAVFRIFIATYEHDSYYAFMFDWLMKELKDWKPEQREIDMSDWWKEPNYGGKDNGF